MRSTEREVTTVIFRAEVEDDLGDGKNLLMGVLNEVVKEASEEADNDYTEAKRLGYTNPDRIGGGDRFPAIPFFELF
jgi:hypothetical protein